jgi:beta-glucanase (GH16 family)
MKTILEVFLIVCCAEISFAPSVNAGSITWSGYQWNLKSGTGMGPGPNNWSVDNVVLDSNGDLELKITNSAGSWNCAEITSAQNFSFGTFQFGVEARVDQLDRNVVLGLFQYTGPDGVNEQDVEFSQFGVSSAPHGNFTVYPATTGFNPTTRSFSFDLGNSDLTQSQYDWQSAGVAFKLFDGFHDHSPNLLYQWEFRPSSPQQLVPQSPMPVHVNLWLVHGTPPSDSQPVTVKLKSFAYTPPTK